MGNFEAQVIQLSVSTTVRSCLLAFTNNVTNKNTANHCVNTFDLATNNCINKSQCIFVILNSGFQTSKASREFHWTHQRCFFFWFFWDRLSLPQGLVTVHLQRSSQSNENYTWVRSVDVIFPWAVLSRGTKTTRLMAENLSFCVMNLRKKNRSMLWAANYPITRVSCVTE